MVMTFKCTTLVMPMSFSAVRSSVSPLAMKLANVSPSNACRTAYRKKWKPSTPTQHANEMSDRVDISIKQYLTNSR